MPDWSAIRTSLQTDHRDSDVLFNHYRDLVHRKDAAKFWHILPSPSKVIPMPEAG